MRERRFILRERKRKINLLFLTLDIIHKIKKKDYKLCILTEDSLFNYYCK